MSLYRIQPRIWEETLSAEGEPVIFCHSRLPELSLLEGKAQRRINRFYIHVEERFQRWCRRRLLPRADDQRRAARTASRPFEPWDVSLDYEEVRWEEDDCLAVALSVQRESGGELMYCAQQSLVWTLHGGFPQRIETPSTYMEESHLAKPASV